MLDEAQLGGGSPGLAFLTHLPVDPGSRQGAVATCLQQRSPDLFTWPCWQGSQGEEEVQKAKRRHFSYFLLHPIGSCPIGQSRLHR